MTVVRSFSS